MRAGGRNPTSDFVQDYAAKRQAQMDRAKQLREERLQQQQQQQSIPVSGQRVAQPHRAGGAAGEEEEDDDDDDDYSHAPVPSRAYGNAGARTGSGTGASGRTSSVDMLYVSEDDFKHATQAGLITPDQARQLWAMLSNQIIRIGRDVPTPTTSVNSLLALSHHGASSAESHSSLSSSARSSKATGGGRFGESVSIPALRNSIARFKESQHRASAGGASASSPTARGAEAAETYAAPSLRGPGGGGGGGVNSRSTGRTTTGGGSKKPAWNMDMGIQHDEDARAYDPLPPMPDPEEDDVDDARGGQFGRRPARPPASRAPKKSAATAMSGAGPRGPAGAKSAAASAAMSKPSAPDVASSPKVRAAPPVTMSGGGGGGTGLDDMPVGRGQASAMTDWANAYPPGMAPPSRGGGGGGGLSERRVGGGDTTNDEIAAQSAAAAAEPLGECGYCGRSFRQSLLARHEVLCKKSGKPRRAFDMKAQRADGVEGLVQAQHEAKAQQRVAARSEPAAAAKSGKMPKWKLQHQQFQAAMKSVQQVNQAGGFGSGAALPPPPTMPAELDDRVLCPHCGRKFADDVATRHIPKCATTVNKPKGIRPIRR